MKKIDTNKVPKGSDTKIHKCLVGIRQSVWYLYLYSLIFRWYLNIPNAPDHMRNIWENKLKEVPFTNLALKKTPNACKINF